MVADTVYDPATRRVSNTTVSQLAWNAPIDTTGYVYNAAGQITATVDKQATAATITNGIVATGQATDTQCYTYDYAGRLSQAWTDTAGATGTVFGQMKTTGAGNGTIADFTTPPQIKYAWWGDHSADRSRTLDAFRVFRFSHHVSRRIPLRAPCPVLPRPCHR